MTGNLGSAAIAFRKSARPSIPGSLTSLTMIPGRSGETRAQACSAEPNRFDGKSCQLECLFEAGPNSHIILDEKDAQTVRHCSPSAGASGSSTTNSAPPPALLAARNVPPASWIISAEIVNPRPRPMPASFVVKKASNRRGSRSGLMPLPVSLILMTALQPSSICRS